MASLEYINYVPHRAEIVGDLVEFRPVVGSRITQGLPQLFWENGSPWLEVCAWARERAATRGADIKTVQSNMQHLLAFANYLEEVDADWRHFPQRKEDRILDKWRGALIDSGNAGDLASSTVSQRMNATIGFYRFAYDNNLFDRRSPLWVDRNVVVRYFDSVGFARTLNVLSTDLSIPNRKVHGTKLEGGLLPLSSSHMKQLLVFTQDLPNVELDLLLKLGFFTGGRISTLATLRIATVEKALQEPKVPELYRLAVGPSAKPAVRTKYNVDGHILVPVPLLEELKRYMYSIRRLKREALASRDNKDLIFLTRFGNCYVERESDKSPAINREVADLRIEAYKAGLQFMKRFKFHQTRATFGTWLMEIALSAGDPVSAIAFVQDALLHKHESTTFKYIKFIRESKQKAAAAAAFSEAFTGVKHLVAHEIT